MILMNDFSLEDLALKESMQQAIHRVIASGSYVLSKEVLAFESAWAHSCMTRHGIGVANGMDAIELILRSLYIGPGDEVITTSMTAFATVLAILRAGATPVLADIDPETALLSGNSVQRCISPRTKALLLVHLYGQLRNMDQWLELCTDKNIFLIEDCAQSHLANYEGKIAGSFGIAGAFSFYPTKNLGALGDAGMIVTRDQSVEQRARKLRNYGQSVRYHHPDIGMNSRLDEIQAAILLERMKWLDNFTQKRRVIAGAYFDQVNNPLIEMLATPQMPLSHVYHLFVVLADDPKALQSHLERFGVQSLIHYPIPVHRQPPCLDVLRDPMGLKFSEIHASRCISIPCHPQLKDDDVATIILALNCFGRQK